ncbi:MAG: DNA mismatch repair protein MutS [Oligoflexus sp.]
MAHQAVEDLGSLTPMMRQFFELKSRAQDAILFFRMGDFFEIFGDDALEVAPKLELVLTSRERGDKQRIPFCGVPHHSAKNYWIKLLKMGYRIALADQVENPDEAKGLVKRDIVQVFTPGCVDELDGLEADRPNYLMAIHEDPKKRVWAMVLVDVSTGEFRCGELTEQRQIATLVAHFRPREVLARQFILDDVKAWLAPYCQEQQLSFASLPEAGLRDVNLQKDYLKRVFGEDTLPQFPCGPVVGGPALVAAVLAYLESLHASLNQFLTIHPLLEADVMVLDETAIRDLEIFETVRRRQADGSLFKSIHETLTPMGTRLLRASLAAPFTSVEKIKLRQQGVGALMHNADFLLDLRSELRACPDLERLATRVLSGKAYPLELAYLREVLRKALDLAAALNKSKLTSLEQFQNLAVALNLAKEPFALLASSLVDHPSQLGTSLEVIKEGFDHEFDEKRLLSQNGQSAIQNYEQKLRQETGINSLKIKQHKTFGLLIEVTKSNLSRVPEEFVRRQTMVNNERFVTEDLIELDQQLSSATDIAMERELLIYQKILNELGGFKKEFQQIASGLAQLDLLQSFAWKAQETRYQQPTLSKDKELIIRGGRHPVVESIVGSSAFTPNDIVMQDPVRHLLITGPNMAGKSTAMRQTAIIAILHQIGSYVPAEEARLPIFDRIFTRVGAADDLSRGQSTFMVEMSEAAQILRQATERSLVILDEVGRGTSTQDGMAVAAAILENLVLKKSCYTLFATHYHELVPLADELPGLAKVQTEVLEEGGKIHFTHRLIAGASGSSFGLEVAKLAGIPEAVIQRAEYYLDHHVGQVDHLHQNAVNSTTCATEESVRVELREDLDLPLESRGLALQEHIELAKNSLVEELVERLRKINIHKTTPLQALNILDQLKVMVERGEQPDLFEDFAH